MPLPVVPATISEAPVTVGGLPVIGVEGEPLPVTLPAAEPAPIAFYNLDAAAMGPEGRLDFENVLWAVVVRSDEGSDGTDAKVFNGPSGSSYGVSLAGGERFEIPAIGERPFTFSVQLANAATAQVAYRQAE